MDSRDFPLFSYLNVGRRRMTCWVDSDLYRAALAAPNVIVLTES